jgi:hypothetical protein
MPRKLPFCERKQPDILHVKYYNYCILYGHLATFDPMSNEMVEKTCYQVDQQRQRLFAAQATNPNDKGEKR